MAEVFALDSDWKQVKIGAGGWVTGIDIHSDGTMVIRTDTAGAFIWNGTEWVQLVTAYSMPADTVSSVGVYELRIAPSDSNIFYMETNGGVYKSIDQGATWIKTSFPTVYMDANAGNRMDGQKMAIDPNDANIVYAGTQKDGLWVTRDGGASWQKIAAVPQGTNSSDAGFTGIVIHNSTIYVGTAGNGVYRSDDAGVSWMRIPGGPVDVSFAVVSPSGELYVTGNSETALWKYSNGTWTKLIADNVHAVAIDPFNPLHIVAASDGGGIRESDDGGATWSEWNWHTQLESSDDIPWLEDSGPYLSSGGIMFDPNTPDKLYQSAGVGVWNTILDEQPGPHTVLWRSQSVGIENVVPNDIIAPLGGNPVFASWDRAFIEMSDVDSYATDYSGGAFSMGWSIDYASTDPSFLVGISDYWGVEHSGYSTDGGKTWQEFEGLPSFAWATIGGSIAASTPTNFIWAAAHNVAPAYTLDGGQTWTSITVPGITDWSGFHHAYYLKRTTITADRVDDNTFYLYDVYTGVYVTKDGGVSWTKVFDGQVSPWSYWNAKIEAVPGSEGELFFTSGNLAGDPTVAAEIPFMHSTDGGKTWQAVAGVEEVTTFGYGAAKVEGGPVTVFIVGFVNKVYGIYYSTDNAQSWTQIGRYPMGNLDDVTAISGDMDDFGMVYVGLGGKGYVYLDVDDLADPLPQPATPAPTEPVSAPDPVPAPPPPVTPAPTEPVSPPAPVPAPPPVTPPPGPTVDLPVVVDTPTPLPQPVSPPPSPTGAGGATPAPLLQPAPPPPSLPSSPANPSSSTPAPLPQPATPPPVLAVSPTDAGGSTPELLPQPVTPPGSPTGNPNIEVVDVGAVDDDVETVDGVEPQLREPAADDFNGDGRSDILWRDDGGALNHWFGTASGFVTNDANSVTAVSTSWQVAGTGDFNGDGRADILWRNNDGRLSDWLGTANGAFSVNDPNALTSVSTSWSVAGTGDFNGDGRDDILWRNSDGQVSNWLGTATGGFASNDVNALTSAATNWQISGAGDFNGDGRDDILWSNDVGQISNWLGQADGGFVNNDSNAFASATTDWNIVGTGDFNGDGRDDILWRNDAGQLSNWLGQANGGFIANDVNALTTVDTNWSVVAIGDYNGDGRDDILWRDDAGQLSNWLATASGGFINNDDNASANVSTNWHVQSADMWV